MPQPLTMKLNASSRAGRNLQRRQRGVTLLESLVSIVILAVAVLGMLGVQLRTLAETQTTVRRAQAIRLIEDFGERLKSSAGPNPPPLGNYVSDWATVPTGATNCGTGACTPAQLATWDVQEWKRSLGNTLPNAQASIFLSTAENGDPGNRRQLGVIVGWRANERTGAAATPDYVTPLNASTNSPVVCPAGLICHLVYVQR
ncbi:MAG: type IV pilus modification protein PilV [Burkholderiales bacterium]